MLRLALFACFYILFSGGIFAQSIILNGDFESYSNCPTGNSQFPYVNNWTDGVLSSDYINCAYTGWSPHIGGAYQGTGYVGGASYGNSVGAAEGYCTSPTVPFIAGQAYRFRLYTKMSNGGSYNQVCGGVCFYGRMNAPPPQTGVHPANVAGATLIGCTPTVSNTTWAVVQTTFVPTANFTWLQVTEGTATTSANCRQYIYIDSFSVTPASILNAANISFLAEEVEDGVRVNWVVSDEAQIQSFEVERKGDVGEFQRIHSQNAGGTLSYDFLDENRPLSDYHFYRVRQINTDGSEVFSPILKVKAKDPAEFMASVNPNPFAGTGTLEISLPREGRVNWQIYNLEGKTVLNEVDFKSKGTHSIQLDMKDQKPGIYLLRVIFEDKVLNSRLVELE
ncbi:MAG: T9SS type A sorting domain-containing protein [Bacteroidia bacterium]|nr:T9SS type A sorting domain-containing protein [Bacteroidia bacterium]